MCCNIWQTCMALVCRKHDSQQEQTLGSQTPIGYLSFGVNTAGCMQVAAALAGVPERADWKQCQGSEAQEAARTDAFKALFKPFDIMQ